MYKIVGEDCYIAKWIPIENDPFPVEHLFAIGDPALSSNVAEFDSLEESERILYRYQEHHTRILEELLDKASDPAGVEWYNINKEMRNSLKIVFE